jgi:4-hydroxy-tetrahydrodipicolinate reductase
MANQVKIGIVGVAGRMGRALVRAVGIHPGAVVVGGTESPGSPALGTDIGTLAGIEPLAITVAASPEALFAASDVVLDFTAPAATVRHAALAAETGTALVAGTTGLDAAQEARIAVAAERAAVVRAANMSVGVNLLGALTRRVAAVLGPEFDIEILEMHHRYKVDAPSGTALALGRAAAAGRGVDHDAGAARGRDGHTGARRAGDIGYAVLRGGNVAGEHAVIFAADDERIELVHKAGDRTIFARGAVVAGVWLAGRAPGLYGMDEVLGLDG